VAAGSGVGTNVAPGTTVSGFPALPHDKSLEIFLYARRQKALHERVERLQKQVEALDQSQRNEKGST
jgi:UDP-3-O-[3-hydroxymyristoyl] glucosamine N-acyltransferase